MSAAFATHPRAGDGAPLAYSEIVERAALAARYADAAASLAAVQDGPGMAHALGCAGRALLAASEAAATLRPALQNRGTA